MRFISKIQAAVVAGLVASASPLFGDESGNVDFTQPTFGSNGAGQEDYVDPKIARRRSCLDHPGRPGWMMVQTDGFEWRTELAMRWKERRSGRLISEAESCTCDMLHPDFDQLRDEVETMWAMVGDKPRSEWSNAMADRFNDLRSEIASEARSYSFQIGRLCGNPE